MFHFARLLHSAGFLVTFINIEQNHALMLSRGRQDGGKRDGDGDGIRYEAIPDGLSPSERGAQDYGFGLLHAVRAHCPGHLRELIARINTGRGGAGDSPSPPVTCVVASELMSFAARRGRGAGRRRLHAVGHQRMRPLLRPRRARAQAQRLRTTQR